MLRKCLFILLVSASAAHAQEFTHCVPTKAIATVNYPGADKIPHTNNMVLPAGKAIEAEGQKLMLVGRLLDVNCMPVKDAQIEIWQPDPFGKWFLAQRDDLATPLPVFTGAGRGFSNTTGEFFFHTLFPSSVNKRAPFINVKIKARGMKEFNTQLFFGSDMRNAEDPVYKRLKEGERPSVTLTMQPLADRVGFAALVDIVLPEKAKFVAY